MSTEKYIIYTLDCDVLFPYRLLKDEENIKKWGEEKICTKDSTLFPVIDSIYTAVKNMCREKSDSTFFTSHILLVRFYDGKSDTLRFNKVGNIKFKDKFYYPCVEGINKRIRKIFNVYCF